MNLKEEKYSRYALIREMLETPGWRSSQMIRMSLFAVKI